MMNLRDGIRFLAEGGLNLLAVLDCAALPQAVVLMMVGSGVPLADYRHLLLVGHGGRRMWQALKAGGFPTVPDPVDHYSISLTRRFIRDYLDDAPAQRLYPGTDYIAPLQQLGQAAGWSFPSPLGSGISPVYGVWFAYRAAFLVDADLPLVRNQPTLSPCDSCVDKPCITTCPIGAVQLAAFDSASCVEQRLRPHLSCADRCLARMACPFFPQHTYTLPQIQYHYGRSLDTLRAWYGVNEL